MEITRSSRLRASLPLEIAEIGCGTAEEKGEVLGKLSHTGVYHDAYTLPVMIRKVCSPVVLGHEGAGVVVEVGGEA